jgi:hypothetical protein
LAGLGVSVPNFTYAIHDSIFNWLAGQPFITAPTGVFAGLLTQSPNPDGTGITEPTDVGYARQSVTFSMTQSQGVTTLTNTNALVFGVAIQNWTPVNWLGLFDQNGNLILYGRLRTTRLNTAGNSLTFAIGAITIGLQ